MDGWSGGVCWLPDSSGFYVTVIDGAAVDFSQRVIFFRIADASSTEISVPWVDPGQYRMIQVSADGARLLAIEGMPATIPSAWAQLDDPASPQWRELVRNRDVMVGGFLIGDSVVAFTDVGAPRGRVVRIPLDLADASDPSQWIEIVPESDVVIRGIKPVGDLIYVHDFVDTYSQLRIIGIDGSDHGTVPLPGKGAIAESPFVYQGLSYRPHADTFFFSYSSLVQSWTSYQHTPGDAECVQLSEPDVVLPDAIVEDCWASSPDGTRIPYHLVRRADAPSTPLPALIYAYGGFNAPWVPAYPGGMAAFVHAGGVYVHAHLRGGCEYGRDWWEAGRMRHKQNCYADLYAVAEQLIAEGVTTAQQLGVTGGSNGGLMAGVAATQRPELWGAVIPRVPIFDLIGGLRDGYGRMAIGLEYADVDDPEEIVRLTTFSPYHLVTDRAYPPIWIDAGDTDPRCPPWHARKLAARMQAAQRGDAPILVRIWENVGHGWATDKDIALEQHAEWLAFAMKHTGLTPRQGATA
jgi:prolyl oligopeptidase